MDILSVILFLIFFISIILLLYFQVKNRKKRFVVLLLCALLLLDGGIIFYNTIWFYADKTIYVNNANGETFRLQLDNHIMRYESQFMQFFCEYSQDKMVEKLKRQQENIFYDEVLQQIVIIAEDNIYTLRLDSTSRFLWSQRYKYIFSSNTVSLRKSDTEYIEIPFPIKALDEEIAGYHETMEIVCGFDTLQKYYEQFSNAKIENNIIELKWDEATYVIKVEGENVCFEIKDKT